MNNELVKLQDTVEELDIKVNRLSKRAYSRGSIALSWTGNKTLVKTFDFGGGTLGVELVIVGELAQVSIALDGVALITNGANIVATNVDGVARGEHTLDIAITSSGNCQALLSLSGTNIRIN